MISVKLLFNIKALHFFAFISAGNEPSAVLARAFGECCEVFDLTLFIRWRKG